MDTQANIDQTFIMPGVQTVKRGHTCGCLRFPVFIGWCFHTETDGSRSYISIITCTRVTYRMNQPYRLFTLPPCGPKL